MKVLGYRDMLGQVKGLPCVAFEMFGNYQGDWIGVLDAGENLQLWKGYYGSCSECDFIESERDWKTGEIPDERAVEYFKEDRPFIEIPKILIKNMTLEQFLEIIPVNIRKGIYDFEPEELFKDIKKVICSTME